MLGIPSQISQDRINFIGAFFLGMPTWDRQPFFRDAKLVVNRGETGIFSVLVTHGSFMW